MRCALARVCILLSIALALANAQCFARCLVAAPGNVPDHATPPCHSHGHSPQKTQAAGPQHDIRPAAAPMVPLSAVAAGTTVIASPFSTTAKLHPPPPLSAATTSPPLRI